jgi:CheY-like chemotaxis protein
VLVVDGDADNRELYRESLVLAGWHVAEATDGRDALVQALAAKPSVVLTELRLPVIDGVALCEILRRDRSTSNVPILVVTSESRASELARAHRAGANAVLVKPSTPDVIVAEIGRLLDTPQDSRSRPRLPSPGDRRLPLVKAHQRIVTTSPETPPAALMCPMCAHPLRYLETFIGGVSQRHPERWDYFDCFRCGRFQFRYRTRKLRHIS